MVMECSGNAADKKRGERIFGRRVKQMQLTKTLEKATSGKGGAGGTAALEVRRKEVKYFVSRPDFLAAESVLDKALERDSHDRGKGYFIRSLYFDTLENRAFEEKMAGVERRKKIRLRIYDLKAKMAKLEIKNKVNDCILKESIWVKREDAERLQSGDFEALLEYEGGIARKAYAELRKYCYRPVVVIDYIRHAFVYPFNNTRITFDTNLKANNIDLNMFDSEIFMKPLLDRGLAVMEVKFDGFIPGIVRELAAIKSCNSAISKYCIGRLDNRLSWI